MIMKVQYVTEQHYQSTDGVCPSCKKQGGVQEMIDVPITECPETGQFLECRACDAVIFVHTNPETIISEIAPVEVTWHVKM